MIAFPKHTLDYRWVSRFPTEIDRLLERQSRLLTTNMLTARRSAGVDLAERILKMSDAGATLARLSGLSSMQQLKRYSGMHTQLAHGSSLSRLSGLFPMPTISMLDRISPVLAMERAWGTQLLGLKPSSQLSWVNEIARLQQRLASGSGLAIQQAALERVGAHLPQTPDPSAIVTPDYVDAMLQAMAELSEQVKELQREARKPALLRADFLISQLLIIFVLMLTIQTQAFDGQTQDIRWSQVQAVQEQILTLERQQVRALAKEYRAQYIVKERPTPLRSSYKAKAPVISLLYPNTGVHLVTSRGPWVKVELFDVARGEYRYGWCLKKYLQRVKPSAHP